MRKRLPKGMRKITCSKCGKSLETNRLNQRYCLSCHAKNMVFLRLKYKK